ncbi:MAG: TIGR00269 family protein [Candidatus Bathyarchaeota archaeon]|nr:TIGR00269 family protein [Candidatus Bathyarchaeota archaeon]
MVKCYRCPNAEASVWVPYAKLYCCKGCFNDFLIKRVMETVKKYNMFTLDDKIGVAVSGGKDSAVLLYALKTAFPSAKLIPFHINLGIECYSENCLKKAIEIAKMLELELFVYELREERGFSIDDFRRTKYKRKLCSVCGVIKRRIFNEVAERLNIDVLETGHNLDDLVEIMFSNFLAGDFKQLIKLKPVVLPFHPKLVKKVKPLFRIPENETALYAYFNNLPIREVDCPYAAGSRLLERKKLLEVFSQENPSFKYQLLSVFLKKLIPILEEKEKEETSSTCEVCGFPASTKICGSCRRIMEIKSILKNV